MISVNIDKAKSIAHEMRRAARAEEFKPFDEVIMKQIFGQMEKAEVQRQIIRDKYVGIQVAVNAATTPDEIKVALKI